MAMRTLPLASLTEGFLLGREEGPPEAAGRLTRVVLAGDRISRSHAELRRLPGGAWTVTDLDSTNGTFLVGRPGKLTPRVALPLPPGAPSRLFLGGFLVVLDPSGGKDGAPLLHLADLKDTALLEVRGVTVDKPSGAGRTRRILQNVSFTAFPQRVLAIMGGSGTGKSTLLKAINGYEPPAQGSVLLNEKDLHASLELRQAIGYLPQEDIFHEHLSIREILACTARLRTPGLPAQERERRITRAIEAVALQSAAEDGRLARVLSGGQRKRLGIAMELLSEPKVLFLDEPTSGLSSEDSYDLLCTLRRIARELGTCVLMVIHQPSVDVFKQIDDLVVLKKDPDTPAELIYAGPAYPDSIRYFQQGVSPAALAERYGDNLSPDVILLATEGAPDKGSLGMTLAQWRTAWQASGFEALHLPVPTTIEARELPALRPFGFGQFRVLLTRTARLKLRDRRTLALVFLQPLVIGLALKFALGHFDPTPERQPWNHHFFMMFSALWCGASNPPNEIVGEWKIFYRERMVNLKIPSYYCSKLVTFLGLSLCQCAILAVVLGYGCGLSIPMLPLIGVLWLTAAAGNILGLLISCLAPTADFAVSMVPVPLIFMLLFSGGPIKRLPDMETPALIISAAMPSRWSFEALVAMEGNAQGELGRSWHHDQFDLRDRRQDRQQPREDTARGVPLPLALGCLAFWNLILLTLSALALQRKADSKA